jgi:cytochrome c oxidase subunit II
MTRAAPRGEASMLPDFLEPPAAGSDMAERVDDLFYLTLGVAAFFSLLIAGLILYLGIKYRRRGEGEVGRTQGSAPASLEVVWTVIPLAIVLFIFYRGADVFMVLSRPPADADEYFVVGRQWMWKIQHPDGPREINELHAPVGRAIRLTMISEDVIHAFYVPAFRVKADVIPGRYTTAWFRATEPGVYHLFCAEYCGTQHSGMVGRVIVMAPFEYEQWLAGGGKRQGPSASGAAIFNERGCVTCHRPDTAARAPLLEGLLGRTVRIQGGGDVKADEAYIRESILRPAAKVVAGYSPIMPAYEGQLSEEEILQLISYIRSLQGSEGGAAAGGDRQ